MNSLLDPHPDFEFVDATNLRTPAGMRAWRQSRGLSQVKLAELLEVHEITISKWEREIVPIPKTVELALRWLDQELAHEPLVSDQARDLILVLCAEAGDDISDVDAVLEGFTSNHHTEDIEAAAGGDLRALIRLRKDCGLPAFR